MGWCIIEHMSEARTTPRPGTTRLTTDDLLALVDELSRDDRDLDAGEQIAQIEALERLKSATAARQARLTARLDTARRAARAHAQGRRLPDPSAGIAAEIALARRESPHTGQRRLQLARALTTDLPHTMDALRVGDISEDRAMIVAAETADLSPADRRTVDAELHDALPHLGDRQLRRAVRRASLRIDEDAATRRHRRARAERRVTGRLLGDGTGRLTAVLPQEHYATVLAALGRAAGTARAHGDPRTRDQVKADTLVARVTGTDPRRPTPIAVRLVVTAETLLGTGHEPGDLPGVGPLPATLCRELVHRAATAAAVTLKRLFSMPGDHELVALESRSRAYDGALAELIGLRDDGTCRTPWCNAPIRHTDHVVPARDGGPTSAHNGQGLCELCNYVKETPGWTSWVGPADGPHEVGILTPSGHAYTSRPPPLPATGSPPTPTETGAGPRLPDGWILTTISHRDLTLIA